MTADFSGKSLIDRNTVLILLLCSVSTITLHCNRNTQSDYQKEVAKELAKDIRNDSLFLGYHFGMTKKEFYDHSWNLNKEEMVLNGNGAEILQYENDLKAEAQKIFYPKFKEDKIVRMPVKYSYNGWAPWNRHLWADSLKQDVKRLLEEKYNIKFQEMSNLNTSNQVLYHISANKEIRISEMDNSVVLVEYIDLSQIK